jgi:hypothetical protein
VEHVTESDHPWIANHSRSSSIEIDCTACSTEWRYNGPEFIKIASEREVERLRSEQAMLQGELQEVAAEVVNAYLGQRTYPSVAAEWRDLKNLGLFSESLAIYRRRRGGGRSVTSLLLPRWDNPWVRANLTATQRQRTDAIESRLTELQSEMEQATQSVVRVPFTRSPSSSA